MGLDLFLKVTSYMAELCLLLSGCYESTSNRMQYCFETSQLPVSTKRAHPHPNILGSRWRRDATLKWKIPLA